MSAGRVAGTVGVDFCIICRGHGCCIKHRKPAQKAACPKGFACQCSCGGSGRYKDMVAHDNRFKRDSVSG
jgi:hypothetical protein